MSKKLCVVIVLVLAALGSMVARPSPVLAAEGDAKTITVRTVPPLAGVRVELDGVTAVTDAAGVLTFESPEFRGSAERMVVLDSKFDLPDGDGYYEYTRSFGASLNVVLGFDMYREVGFRFETLQGRKLGLDEIDSLQLKNTLGGRYEDVDRSKPVLLHANRVVSSPSGPIIRDVVWSVDSVMVGTSNVVNKSEIRFLPATDTDILITALFFDAEFTVNDLLFGFAIGEAVLVEDPGGVVTRYPLEDGRLVLKDLPRGEYRATVVGPGVKLARPVALSRNQSVDLALLSYLDLAVVGLSGMLFASGTLALGLRRRKRRRQAAGSKSTAPSKPKFWRRRLGMLTRLRPWRRSLGTDLENLDFATTSHDVHGQAPASTLVRTHLSPLNSRAESVESPVDPEFAVDPDMVHEPGLVEDGEFAVDPELVEDGELALDPEFAVDPGIAGDHEFEYFLGIVDDVWAVGDLEFVGELRILDDLGPAFDLEIIDDVWSEPTPVRESLPLPPTLTLSGGRWYRWRSGIVLYFSQLESAVVGLGRPETYTTAGEDDQIELVADGPHELAVDVSAEPAEDDERELVLDGPGQPAEDDERDLVLDGPGQPAEDDEDRQELAVDDPGAPAEHDEDPQELVMADGHDGRLVDEDDQDEAAEGDDNTEPAEDGETARSPRSVARWDVAS